MRIFLISFSFIVLFPVFVFPLHAEQRYEQKLILVEGTQSRFMDGEHHPVFDFDKNKVLPYLLARGWSIRSVHINEKSRDKHLFGYVIVERKLTDE